MLSVCTSESVDCGIREYCGDKMHDTVKLGLCDSSAERVTDMIYPPEVLQAEVDTQAETESPVRSRCFEWDSEEEEVSTLRELARASYTARAPPSFGDTDGKTPRGAPVILHIYDVTRHITVHRVNQVLHPLGTGAFHGGVEIYADEWSYGYCEQGTGIFDSNPGACDEHQYRESIVIGETTMDRTEVNQVIDQLRKEYPGCEYDLLRRNCCTFSNELCERLGVGPIPTWITNLAAAGATIEDGVIKICEATHHAGIIIAARAGDFHEEFHHVTGKAKAEAKHVLEAVRDLGEHYHIRERALEIGHHISDEVHHLSENAHHVVEKIEEKYHISEHAHHLSDNAVHLAARVAADARHALAIEEKAVGPKCQNSRGANASRWRNWCCFSRPRVHSPSADSPGKR